MEDTLASSAYRLAVRAYPRRFRAQFGDEMIRVFEEGLCEARRQGSRATVRYLARVGGDLILSGLREHLAALDRTAARPGP